ncbi:MAG: glycosyltransferase family 4 protein [Anaerolineaceae bacterium]|jgi:glycosyltransferase involved in cell wall biosynthesis|nr:glycosyltransferase family 4 protein [Anaerolineaceae bacterium]
MKIGVLGYRFDYYPYLRNILYKLPEAEYVPVKDLYSNLRRAALFANRRLSKDLFPAFDLNNQFDDFELNKVDILHFSNGVSFGRTPWISHFETLLPRFSGLMQRYNGKIKNPIKLTPLIQRGFAALQSPSCKRIIAWSQSAANIQSDLLTELPFEERETILKKMVVLHPPQELLVESPLQKQYSSFDPIRFILVGSGFFRKGGLETLKAFEKLVKNEGAPIKLVIVSSLRLEPYAARETEVEKDWAVRFIEENSDWIEYYSSLPNDKTIELIKKCDIGLLPTYADSYGFSVLEAQACGLPVISTDVRALPEINNTDIGWIIRVPKNDLGEALYFTAEDRERLSQQIQAGLEAIIHNIVADPSVIFEKAVKSIERIREMHDPTVYAQKLRAIYQDALQE